MGFLGHSTMEQLMLAAVLIEVTVLLSLPTWQG